jgi:phosphorylcholine metabolism protein LicD
VFEQDGRKYYIPRERPKEAYAILDEFVGLCERLDVPCWVYMGTALGFYRDGGWNKWDRDIDVVILEKFWPVVKEAMLGLGYEALPYTMHFFNEYYILLNVSSIEGLERHFSGYTWLRCNGKRYRGPDHIEKYLEETYGDTWQTPIEPDGFKGWWIE